MTRTGLRPSITYSIRNMALDVGAFSSSCTAETRMGVLVRGQGNTGVVFGFVISKQTAPLCGFEKSNAERESRGHQRGVS